MVQRGEASGVLEAFFDAYLVKQDLNRTLAHLAEDVHWMGIGASQPVRGRTQAEQALRLEFELSPGFRNINYETIEESILSERCAVVLCVVTLTPSQEADPVCFRATATCAQTGDGVCRIVSIHVSTPDIHQDVVGFYPASSLNRMELERRLGPKALDILGRSIPGGMMGGYLEPDFPLYYVNDLMLSYLGYTYEEFVSAIDGKVINCMHPDDRAQVDALVAEAFSKGKEYEVQYRLRKKDGSYIWVNDIGKKGLSVDGREVCISVIRDISTEMEVRARLEAQAAEQKHLARQYDYLFQSVLCGIVQFHLSGTKLVFKNANREAIRIFGYEPEEFWAKREWNLSDVIAEEDRDSILKAATRLRRPEDKVDYEFRLLKKDGTSCWLIGSAEVTVDGEGEQITQSVFLDINARKGAEQRSQLLSQRVEASNEILQMALEHTATCEFYYYPQTGECDVPARTCSIYHCEEHYKNMPYSFARELVDPTFHPAFYDMYERIARGERTATCEFRSKNSKFWCRETLSVILHGENGDPQLVIGIVENITRQKEAEAALEEARSRDSLTGLYNKETGIRLIQEYMASEKEPDDHSVMMILDMDNFDHINKAEGAPFADAVLQEVADILRSETGPDNFQIRLGGDEFMLFIKHCNKKIAVDIGPRIAGLVRNILANTEKDIKISASIGMCSTEVADEYNALYRCAESTLKYVKEHGKGQAACYLDTSNELGIYLTQLYTEKHPVNAIARTDPGRSKGLVSFALDLLGKAKNLDDAVSLLLSRIGKLYHFDRVSIIDANREYLTYRFSYQWARNRTDLQLGQNFYVTNEDFDRCAAMYAEDGLADHNVREGISRFPSCLHAGIWNYGEYVGSMSFEVDQPNYPWTQEERSLLIELVKLVPSFIMKSKADAISKAKTDFLSRMSHEIRTPMNAISGMTTIAKSVLNEPKKVWECIEKIESANTYLLCLINDILDMSRIESGKLELNYGAMDLRRQLSHLESLFRTQAEAKHVELRFIQSGRENRPLWADSLRLHQVLVNIIGNALKFTEQGGVTVRVEELETEPRAVLRFSVSDTGIGMEPAALTRIFHAFEQAEPDTAARHGGTGLGLSISSRLVHMMGGTLEVRSELNKGSEFFFTLALEYAPEQAKAQKAPETAPSSPGGYGGHILLAEDNTLNQEIAKTILELNGFTVTCASDGREALDRFQTSTPGEFDSILMDIRMPVMDGLEATRRIRTSGHPDARVIPIFALTANAFDEDTQKSMDSGMNGHLSKPIQVGRMLELLREGIGRRKQSKAAAM